MAFASETFAAFALVKAFVSDDFAAFWLTSAAAAEAAVFVTEPAALISDKAALLAAFSAASFIVDTP
ncbi:hypothetical protein CVE86_24795 [Salmonella enterica]|nr:hypothetical protein [Salmonella enterica]